MANLLTGLRLLLAVPAVLAFALSELISPLLLVALMTVAIATDYFDGIVARRTDTASPRGQLFDHATDFLFVTSGLAGAAIAGRVPAALPILIVVAFSQYVRDSHFLHREKRLRLSLLGRWNGIFYFVPLVLIAVSRLDFMAGAAEVFSTLVVVLSYLLLLSTVASIIDRAVAPLREAVSDQTSLGSTLRTALTACLLASVPTPAAAAPPTPFPQDPATTAQAIRKEAGLMVPMRDGVRLSTDLYFPADSAGPYSTILMRTPYGKDREYPYGGAIPLLVEAGYAVAFQDTRGRYASEGEYTVRFSDREDGYDAVSWLVNQTWSDEQVATFGCSYRGETQITLAAERHPNHIAAIPMAASAAYDPGGRPWTSFDGGAFELAQTAGWFMPGSTQDRLELYRSLPVVDIVSKSGVVGSDYEDFASNTPAADYFQTLDFIRLDDRFDVPALYVDSWYDFGVAETLKLFNQQRERAVSARARDNQYVIIAPSTHCAWIQPPNSRAGSNQRAGARDIGDWRIDFEDLYLRWYRFWLDGQDAGISDMPHVQYYVMGANEWKSADAWPVPGTSFEPFYLHSGGGANSLSGDGSLTTAPPGREPSDAFTYDPDDPVPTLGGQACCTGLNTGAGGYDQSETEARPDVLVYTSATLEEGLEVTGPLEAVLFVSSDAPDTDFTVKLVDVHPDGTAYNVQEGALRMRYREGLSTKVLMEEGEVYEVRFDLHATSNYFGPGHRIRVEVSSSNFPRWSRNLNTGGNNFDETEWAVARNAVHHSAEFPSHVLLPVVPR